VRAKVQSGAFETYEESMLQRSTDDENAVTAARNNLALEVVSHKIAEFRASVISIKHLSN